MDEWTLLMLGLYTKCTRIGCHGPFATTLQKSTYAKESAVSNAFVPKRSFPWRDLTARGSAPPQVEIFGFPSLFQMLNELTMDVCFFWWGSALTRFHICISCRCRIFVEKKTRSVFLAAGKQKIKSTANCQNRI